jgi:hypothetical protein
MCILIIRWQIRMINRGGWQQQKIEELREKKSWAIYKKLILIDI